ncbi:MAG: LysE family translocator [Actinomycetaceae bacterium]|nr:LysE family translocator [Actinomycetaceae bacterium]
MTTSAWITLLTTFALAVISPGPDFLATLKSALTNGRSRGIATGAGIATGTILWATGTMAGVVALISRSDTAFLIVRLAGALFLTGYGVRILHAMWREHRASSAQEAPADAPLAEGIEASSAPYPMWKSFRLGFLTTTVGNPKAVIFFTTLFASILPPTITVAEGAALTALMVLISATWFTSVALAASMPAFVRLYERSRTWIDLALGVLFTALGFALIPWTSLF